MFLLFGYLDVMIVQVLDDTSDWIGNQSDCTALATAVPLGTLPVNPVTMDIISNVFLT